MAFWTNKRGKSFSTTSRPPPRQRAHKARQGAASHPQISQNSNSTHFESQRIMKSCVDHKQSQENAHQAHCAVGRLQIDVKSTSTPPVYPGPGQPTWHNTRSRPSSAGWNYDPVTDGTKFESMKSEGKIWFSRNWIKSQSLVGKEMQRFEFTFLSLTQADIQGWAPIVVTTGIKPSSTSAVHLCWLCTGGALS